jgi:dTDP-4-dehydrorhamnose 3,5-epimerase-like enzyme
LLYKVKERAKQMKLIDGKVRKEVVEVQGDEKMLGVLEKVKFTEVKSGNYFFVYHYAKGFVTTEIFPA